MVRFRHGVDRVTVDANALARVSDDKSVPLGARFVDYASAVRALIHATTPAAPTDAYIAPAVRKPFGLGDAVAVILSAIGITKERVERLVGGPCGCPERQAMLNAAGRAIGIGVAPTPSSGE